MSDLSILVNAIDILEQARGAEGLPAASGSQLQQKVLDFYSSQGLEVDRSLVLSACQTALGQSCALSPEPPRAQPTVSEKRSARARQLGGLAGSALSIGLLFSISELGPIPLGDYPVAYLALFSLGFISFVASWGSLLFSLDTATVKASDRSYKQWLEQIKQAPTEALVRLCQHPMLRDGYRLEVESTLYQRGLALSGKPLLYS